MTSEQRRIRAQIDVYEDRILRAAQDVARLEAELEHLRRGDLVDDAGRRQQELLAGITSLEREIADLEDGVGALRSRLSTGS